VLPQNVKTFALGSLYIYPEGRGSGGGASLPMGALRANLEGGLPCWGP